MRLLSTHSPTIRASPRRNRIPGAAGPDDRPATGPVRNRRSDLPRAGARRRSVRARPRPTACRPRTSSPAGPPGPDTPSSLAGPSAATRLPTGRRFQKAPRRWRCSGVLPIWSIRRMRAACSQAIAGCGAIVSEHPWGTPPQRWTFRTRNRIIAGLSAGLLVLEAGLPSGTFSTADYALAAGRDVFVVPGSIFAPECRGANRLLHQGATPVSDVTELAEALASVLPAPAAEARIAGSWTPPVAETTGYWPRSGPITGAPTTSLASSSSTSSQWRATSEHSKPADWWFASTTGDTVALRPPRRLGRATLPTTST